MGSSITDRLGFFFAKPLTSYLWIFGGGSQMVFAKHCRVLRTRDFCDVEIFLIEQTEI